MDGTSAGCEASLKKLKAQKPETGKPETGKSDPNKPKRRSTVDDLQSVSESVLSLWFFLNFFFFFQVFVDDDRSKKNHVHLSL